MHVYPSLDGSFDLPGSVSPSDAVRLSHPRESTTAISATDGGFRTEKESGGNGPESGGRAAHRMGSCTSLLRIVDIILRAAVLAFIAVSLSVLLTGAQRSEVSILGLDILVSLRWNSSQPFLFLVVVNIITGAYEFVQFVHQSVGLAKKATSLRHRMWVQVAADQACTYLLLAAAAAEAGASRTNKSAFRTLGVESIHIPGVCTLLPRFCSRATIAFFFTLLATIASAIIAALDVYLLTLAS